MDLDQISAALAAMLPENQPFILVLPSTDGTFQLTSDLDISQAISIFQVLGSATPPAATTLN